MVAVACFVLVADLRLVPVAFAVGFAVAAFAVADLLATAFAVTGVAVEAFAVALAVAAATVPVLEISAGVAVASSLPGPVPQRTHHLSAEEPRLWATIERHEGLVHIGPCFLGFCGVPSTTVTTLVLDKPVSALGILLSLELLLSLVKDQTFVRVCAICPNLSATGFRSCFGLVGDLASAACLHVVEGVVGYAGKGRSLGAVSSSGIHNTGDALAVGLPNSLKNNWFSKT